MYLKDDIRLAQNARKRALVNEDDFSIGVVLKSKNGRRYVGSNIKNSLEEISAEQVALEKAISEGEKEFEYIFITAGKKNKEAEKYVMKEEIKNFLKEFVDSDFKIYVLYENNIVEYSL